MIEKPLLLLFEDNPSTGKLVKQSLNWDFEVTWVQDHEQLRSELEDNFFSVIVTDVSIDGETHGTTGYELIDNIRVKRRITRTPVIVYSGVKNVKEIEDNNKKLFFAYLTKGGRDWLENLENLCKKASEQDRHLTSWQTLEAYFEKIEILDSPLTTLEVPKNQSLIGVLDLGENPTWRYLISLINNNDLDDQSWMEIEDLVMNKYEHYSRTLSTP